MEVQLDFQSIFGLMLGLAVIVRAIDFFKSL